MNSVILGSVLITSLNGSERISYNYDVLNEEGDPVSTNKRKTFYAVDEDLVNAIETIRKYILDKRVND